MYHLIWSDTDGCYECCAADNKSAWQIYWALKKLYEKQRNTEAWITIWNRVYCDPRKGSSLPMFQGEDQHIRFVEQ